MDQVRGCERFHIATPEPLTGARSFRWQRGLGPDWERVAYGE